MPEHAQKLSKRHMIWSALALIILFGLWYAFRPEKLFINKRVNEPAPAALAQLTPLYTGTFRSAAGQTSGRATIYRQTNGSRVLTLSNFLTSHDVGLDVILFDGSSQDTGQDFTPSDTNHRDIGDINAKQGEQTYPLPADIDLNRFNTVAIYSAELRSVVGTAKLDAF